MRWSGRTAPASPRWSRSSPGVHQPDDGALLADGPRGRAAQPRGRPRRRDRRHLPGADPVPRPHRSRRTSSWAASRCARAADRPRGDATRRPRRSSAAGRPDRPRPARAGPLDRRPADHRDRQGHLARRAGPLMDEPTAALSGVEVDRLFAVARSLRDAGARGVVHLAPLRGGLRALRQQSPSCATARYVATATARRADRRPT